MKKFLPRVIIVLLFALLLSLIPPNVFAQPAPTASVSQDWVKDSEVSFVGKTGVRSGEFLDWTLQNYSWLCVKKTDQNVCDNRDNPLISFWIIIRNIVYASIALFVLGTAFVLIITRGQNITLMRFIPRFVMIVVLITFSFSLVQFIYQVTDVIQGFFLNIPRSDSSRNPLITTLDLLYIGFDYKNFIGYRLVGPDFDESAFISLLLVRLTAITYYVMTGILLVRKIILWFFIIISPIFPLLLFYRPIRNTAKIWIGEFFRWLLYAPLFAIFLHGLVIVWQKGIPLPFDFSGAVAGDTVYPTAVNILLGGPGQVIGINNSVNLRDTFALYVVALLMLWVVILLPFLLLKIFLDYIATLSLDNNVLLKQFANRGLSFFGSPKGSPSQPPQPPGKFQPAGLARSLPFVSSRQAAVPVQYQASVQNSVRESADIMQRLNISIPRMRDIAQYETSLMSGDLSRKNQISSMHSTLSKIANPASVSAVQEREKITSARQQLLAQKQKGNPIATSVLAASGAAAGVSATQVGANVRSQQLEQLSQKLKSVSKQDLVEKRGKGDKLAASILETQEKLEKGADANQKDQMENQLLDQLLEAEKSGSQLAKEMLPVSPASPQGLPVVNHVQEVSIEDYEEVRKLWTENYQTIEPPKGLNGEQVNRSEWIKNDIEKITNAINLLSSLDPAKINEGMNMVSSILPFLLIGGFSKSEVAAYLKAKMEAGKQVLADMAKKEEEEDSSIGRQTKTTEKAQELKAQIEEPKELGGDALPKDNDNT